MNLFVINTGLFKLDGGAMFGVVPKSLWNRTNPADDKNLITLAMRCLLIEDGNKLILIDNGIGDKQDPKFMGHYYLHGNDSLIKSIHQAGFSPDEVTDVFLTHLHFDHCGGGVRLENGKSVLTFKNATYWSNADHWQWATVPNPREKASFLQENILPMKESGQLKFVDASLPSPFPQFDIFYSLGHTDKMMLPLVKYKDKVLCFVADLIPTSSHVPLPYIMAYDTRPLLSMEEKDRFLKMAAEKELILFFEHDPTTECATVHQSDRGVKISRSGAMHEFI
jgi:glyoxylase-like metal-dependent hydrolase (beta-lactamase superfamily II)